MSIAINGTGTITGLSVGGLEDGIITPAELSTGAPSWDAQYNLTNIASINNGPLAGFRNRIINGDMRVTQRGPLTAAPLNGYTLDRWLFSRTGTGSSTVGQNTNASFGGRFVLTASSSLAAG